MSSSISSFSFFSDLLTMEREHRSSVMLCFVVGGALLCFLTMAKNSMVEDTTVGEAILNGSLFRIAVAATISLAVPVYMNLMVDIYLDNFGKEAKKRTNSKTTNDKDILTNVEKLFLMVGLVIFPLVSCFPGWSKAILLASCASSASVRISVVLPFLLYRCSLFSRCIFVFSIALSISHLYFFILAANPIHLCFFQRHFSHIFSSKATIGGRHCDDFSQSFRRTIFSHINHLCAHINAHIEQCGETLCDQCLCSPVGNRLCCFANI